MFAGALRLRHLSSVRWTRPIKCPGKFFILTLQGRDKLLPEYPAGMSHVPLLGWRISNLTPAVQKLVCSYERWHRVKNEFLTKSSLTEIKTSAAAREHPRSMTAFFSNRILIGEFIRCVLVVPTALLIHRVGTLIYQTKCYQSSYFQNSGVIKELNWVSVSSRLLEERLQDLYLSCC